MFKPLVVKPFQSAHYSCTDDPATGLLDYFYPANFFDDNAYACGDWVNLMRLFHVTQQESQDGYIMTTSIGVAGVAVTFKVLAAHKPAKTLIAKPLFKRMTPATMD